MARDESTGGLILDFVRETTELIRQELRLARTELAQKADQAINGVILVASGAVLAFAGLIVLLRALAAALADWMGPAAAALIVGGIVALIGIVLLLKARRNLDPEHLMPERTLHSLARSADLVEERTR